MRNLVLMRILPLGFRGVLITPILFLGFHLKGNESATNLDPVEVRKNKEQASDIEANSRNSNLRFQTGQEFNVQEDPSQNEREDESRRLNVFDDIEGGEVDVLDPEKEFAEAFENQESMPFDEIFMMWESVYASETEETESSFGVELEDESEDFIGMGGDDDWTIGKNNEHQLNPARTPSSSLRVNPYLKTSSSTSQNPFLSTSPKIISNQIPKTKRPLAPTWSSNLESETTQSPKTHSIGQNDELMEQFGSVLER